jgi:AraC-like DNA-binding protein
VALDKIGELPLVGSTFDVGGGDSLEYWRCIFGGVWGPVELTEIGGGKISGSLRSRHVGELTFNQIAFGNQLFECLKGDSKYRDEPFYSLIFPHRGSADCFVGNSHMHLVPNNAYLINVDDSAKLRVENEYNTFNIQIPVSALEHRLGRRIDIALRDIIQTDPIYHLTQVLIHELIGNNGQLEDSTASFLSSQMLDTIAFFLAGGSDNSSQDTIAIKAIRSRVLAFLDDNFHDAALNPQTIASCCGISRSYLYKVFSDGLSVMEHLKRRRLLAARKMIELRYERMTLTRIAMACGFSSSSEFSRLYKKEFGIKPSDTPEVSNLN